jgi:hypothetical protein
MPQPQHHETFMQREQRERIEAERRRNARLRKWYAERQRAAWAAEITRYAQEVDHHA